MAAERKGKKLRRVEPKCVCGSIKNTVMGCPVCDPIAQPPEPRADAEDAAIYNWRLEQVRELCTTGLETMPTLEFFAWSVLHWIGRYPPAISETMDQPLTKGADHE